MKARFVATAITEFVVTVSMCATTWGLTSGPVKQKAVENETVSRAAVVSNAYDEPASYHLEESAKAWLKFQSLAKEWRAQRGARSSITRSITAPAYIAIIGMGEPGVPLILAQIRSEGDDPDQWFWALESITQENPTRPEDQGNNLAMAKAWLAWGDDKNVG